MNKDTYFIRLAYNNPETGIVSLVCGARLGDLERSLGPLTREEYRDHVISRSIPKGINHWVELPPDYVLPDKTRYTRNAWVLNENNEVVCDMVRARMVHRSRLRQGRKLRLPELDVEYQRADETGNVELKREIAAKKQALRDITKDPRIEAAQTPEDLIALWPEDFINWLDAGVKLKECLPCQR